MQCCTDQAIDYLRRGELFLALVLLLSGDLEWAVFLAGEPLLLALGGGRVNLTLEIGGILG